MDRDELREVALKVFDTYNNIAVQAATGVGKSKIALELCAKFAESNGYQPKVLLVIAERAHYKNWEEEITKWSYNAPVTIVCYASLKKYRHIDWDIVIFDEAHHLGSELRLDVFDTINAKSRIFLSATLKDSLIQRLEQSCGPIKSIKMGLQEAINANILPKPKIFLLPLTLNKEGYNEAVEETWGKADKRVTIECLYRDRWKYKRNKRSFPNVKLIIKCTQQQKYDYMCEQFEYYKKRYMMTRNEAIKNKWLQWGSKRKTYLGIIKTDIALDLLKQLEDKRYVCFCTNIEQAVYLGGDEAIHSNRRDNAEVIRKFNDKENKHLFAVGMLQEGVNLNDIEAGIIIQLDGEERSFIQRFGRTLRADSPEQYIIYYKGTRDEEYLKNALENIDTKYIKEL